jgi:hypothetical protein
MRLPDHFALATFGPTRIRSTRSSRPARVARRDARRIRVGTSSLRREASCALHPRLDFIPLRAT